MEETTIHAERHWRDIAFFCVADIKPHWMDFKVYKTVEGGYDDGVGCAAPWTGFWKLGWQQSGDWLDTHQGAEAFVGGYIKWDGCSQWNFAVCDSPDKHLCGRSDIDAMRTMMTRVFDVAKELMANFDPETAE